MARPRKTAEPAERPPEVLGTTIPADAIQLVGCNVAVDDTTVVVRSVFRAVTYPEALVLEHIHARAGRPDPIRKLVHAGYVRRNTRAEKQRLLTLYKADAVEAVFPGTNPQMERFDPTMAPTPGRKCVVGNFVRAAGSLAAVEPDDPDATTAGVRTDTSVQASGAGQVLRNANIEPDGSITPDPQE